MTSGRQLSARTIRAKIRKILYSLIVPLALFFSLLAINAAINVRRAAPIMASAGRGRRRRLKKCENNRACLGIWRIITNFAD